MPENHPNLDHTRSPGEHGVLPRQSEATHIEDATGYLAAALNTEELTEAERLRLLMLAAVHSNLAVYAGLERMNRFLQALTTADGHGLDITD